MKAFLLENHSLVLPSWKPAEWRTPCGSTTSTNASVCRARECQVWHTGLQRTLLPKQVISSICKVSLACCLLPLAWCLLPAACCLLPGVWLLAASCLLACCLLSAACCLAACCLLPAACCLSPLACCLAAGCCLVAASCWLRPAAGETGELDRRQRL